MRKLSIIFLNMFLLDVFGYRSLPCIAGNDEEKRVLGRLALYAEAISCYYVEKKEALSGIDENVASIYTYLGHLNNEAQEADFSKIWDRYERVGDLLVDSGKEMEVCTQFLSILMESVEEECRVVLDYMKGGGVEEESPSSEPEQIFKSMKRDNLRIADRMTLVAYGSFYARDLGYNEESYLDTIQSLRDICTRLFFDIYDRALQLSDAQWMRFEIISQVAKLARTQEENTRNEGLRSFLIEFDRQKEHLNLEQRKKMIERLKFLASAIVDALKNVKEETDRGIELLERRSFLRRMISDGYYVFSDPSARAIMVENPEENKRVAEFQTKKLDLFLEEMETRFFRFKTLFEGQEDMFYRFVHEIFSVLRVGDEGYTHQEDEQEGNSGAAGED